MLLPLMRCFSTQAAAALTGFEKLPGRMTHEQSVQHDTRWRATGESDCSVRWPACVCAELGALRACRQAIAEHCQPRVAKALRRRRSTRTPA